MKSNTTKSIAQRLGSCTVPGPSTLHQGQKWAAVTGLPGGAGEALAIPMLSCQDHSPPGALLSRALFLTSNSGTKQIRALGGQPPAVWSGSPWGKKIHFPTQAGPPPSPFHFVPGPANYLVCLLLHFMMATNILSTRELFG